MCFVFAAAVAAVVVFVSADFDHSPISSSHLNPMKDLSLRYSEESDAVLKQLSFVVHPREKIGIVGRTGAGKSSLLAALFHLSPTQG